MCIRDSSRSAWTIWECSSITLNTMLGRSRTLAPCMHDGVCSGLPHDACVFVGACPSRSSVSACGARG
eukprot:11702235-Alexandrium_andersonii.AAC.1